MLKSLFFPQLFLKGAVEHVVDNYVRDNVTEPAIGSIVYCDLAFGTSEHSGVYLGEGEIMHLNRKGEIERVGPQEFVSNTSALSIYVSCRGGDPIGGAEIAERAELYRKALVARDYNVILDNCHQFAAACLTGDPDNANNFLWMLKHECKKQLSVDCWRVWERPWVSLGCKPDDQDLDADELNAILDSKMRLFRELNELSVSLSDEVYEHMERCPVDGPFLEKRTSAWEKKNDLFEKRLSGVNVAIDELENEMALLEKQLAALEATR